MIVNGKALLDAEVLWPMYSNKKQGPVVTHGMSEAGYDIRVKQEIVLHPFRRFRLASSVERFSMPAHLVGIVHDKSSWARRGLSVFNTVIEPGWCGFLTLELVYYGWRILKIPAGSGIAQVIFHEAKVPMTYSGRYQHQEDAPVPAKLLD